ncbi:MAG: hypothetical protein KatS3mg019_1955 [Fimbriimonadales bacterium]|nr:MAG: hypothetical protein KatS3mg019_1955 [Fimbriimonadales bacterium]
MWQRVRAGSRLRARSRALVYGWAPMGRYRIEQVFGCVKGAYGSVCRARSWVGARVWVWGMFVLWNMVGLVQMVGDGSFLCWLWVWGVCAIFRTPSHPLDKRRKVCYN